MVVFDKHEGCIVGIGSPHADDAVGWEVIERLQTLLPSSMRLVRLTEPTRLLTLLGECEHVWIVDACRSGRPAGTIDRIAWPDERIVRGWSVSGHGVGLAEVLQLATVIGMLPAQVILYTVAIERNTNKPGRQMSAEVKAAVGEVSECLYKEIAAAPATGAAGLPRA